MVKCYNSSCSFRNECLTECWVNTECPWFKGEDINTTNEERKEDVSMKIYKDEVTKRNKKFEKLVVKPQEEMKRYVAERLRTMGGSKVIESDGYVFRKGTFPVLLLAHMDTVHVNAPSTLVYVNGSLSSPQGIGGDDRCGIYMIFEILKTYDCSVVFLEDEEIGCIGAKKFANSHIIDDFIDEKKPYYLIEFDRKGSKDAVTYDCENPEFDEFVTREFFEKAYGTCSDISYIAPALGVAAVNLSCGYHHEHHLDEWVVLDEMETVISEAKKLLERTKELKKPFEYIEDKSYSYGSYGYSSGYGYSGYGWDAWDDDYYNYTSISISYKVKEGYATKRVYGSSKKDIFVKFFKENPTVCWNDILNKQSF